MRVKINVGGIVYETDTTTLSESEFFKSLLSEQWKADNDSFFIDRDGQLFREVLNWLRRGRLVGCAKSADHYEELLEEAQFFGLEKLVIECQQRADDCRERDRNQNLGTTLYNSAAPSTVFIPLSPKNNTGGYSPWRQMPQSAPVSQHRAMSVTRNKNMMESNPLPAFPREEDEDYLTSRVVCMNDDISPLDDRVCQSVCEGYDAGPRVIGDPSLEDF